MFDRLVRFVRQLPAVSSVAAVILCGKEEQEAAARSRIAAIDVDLAAVDRREEAAEIGICRLAGLPIEEEENDDDGFFHLMNEETNYEGKTKR